MSETEKAQQILREARGCLDCVTLMSLARRWSAVRGQRPAFLPPPRRLALLCSATSEIYSPLLEVCLAARGLPAHIFQPPYGTWQQQILNPESEFHQFAPQLVMLHLTLEQLSRWPDLGSTPEKTESAAQEEARQILNWCEAIHQKHPVSITLANFHLPPHESLSNLSGRHPASSSLHVNRVNIALARQAPDFVTILDVAGLAARHGIDRWFDPTAWYHARQPVAYDATPLFAQSMAATLASVCLGSAKCIVLDLDNTLWGGVVADDGIEGIRLGQGSSEGEAYQSFQRYLLELRRRGILLAVCSKNQESIAREVFERHDQMLIKLSDLSVFAANFTPKADNVRQIARQLNLGLDSLVFLDDSPVERDQMRQFVPEVKVVDLPEDPSAYIRTLERAFLFETPAITSEDRMRAESYAANQQRTVLASQATDVREFLRSLDMHAILGPYAQPHLERITQLINKSNQFNLRTIRYTAAEIEGLAHDSTRLTLSVRLRDRFGDNGLISAIHGQIREKRFRIESWVMSCRVLDRGVEQLALNHLAANARGRGCSVIEGSYQPTPKNGLVKEHYRRLGFELVRKDANGRSDWKLELAAFTPFPCHISAENREAT